MDIFVEQLFSKEIKKSEFLLKMAIFAVSGLVSGMVVLLLLGFAGGRFFPFSFLIAAGLMYLAYFICGQFNVEYEYCLTNGTFDVDTIINMKNRKRLASFDCKEIEDFGKYDNNRNYNCKSVIFAANENEEALYYFVINHKDKGKTLLVTQPNEKMVKGLKRCLPRQMVYNVFGNSVNNS